MRDWWSKKLKMEKFILRNLIWGFILVIWGTLGDNSFILGASLIFCVIPSLLVEFIGAFGEDLSAKIKKDAEAARKEAFFGGVQEPPR